MSFSFFKPRPKTPQELAKAIKDSLMALDTCTVVEVKALEKALEEVEKNFVSMRCMLSGDGETKPNVDQQKADSTHCCVQYLDNHSELLDFLVVCYDNKEIALNCGNMLRECIKFPTLAKYILESPSFELFFKYMELPNFDVASDAFSTFKDLLTTHGTAVSEYLTSHYDEFFSQYEKLLKSPNYVTRRQLLKPPNSHVMKRYMFEVQYLKVMMTLLTDSSKNIQISAFHIFKVFVANPNKPREIKVILAKNHEKLLELLHNLSGGKGSGDEQFDEEKELIIKEIQRVSRLPNH
ncbi:Mo25-like, partial [Dillenia turbinata]